tara:strand:+ start:2292 stop:3314 length:1023 start_codon:yes stop_codon:yes gene_type:complete
MLIEAAISISKFFGLSEFFIGTTIIAFGTSLPELASSISAAISNHSEIVTGNIIGSNITNLTLVLGIASTLLVVQLKEKYFSKKINLLIGASILFLLLSLDGAINFFDGLILLVLFIIFIVREQKNSLVDEEKKVQILLDQLFGKKKTLKEFTDEEKELLKNINYRTYNKLKKKGIDIKHIIERSHFSHFMKLFGISLFSLAALIASSKFLISSAIGIAETLQINEQFIGLSIIAFGTSLPELAVTFSSIKKGLSGILIGNLIGSNMSNLLLVGGVASLITPLIISPIDWWFTLPFMIFVVFLFKNYINTKWVSKVFEGLLLIFYYVLFLFIIIITSGII